MTTITITQTTTHTHRMTPRQWEALHYLITVGGWDATGPRWLLGTWGNTGGILRRLSSAGLATVSVNTYEITDAGRKAYASPQGQRARAKAVAALHARTNARP